MSAWGDSHMRLSTTPSEKISEPHEGLCVTCKHHHYAQHPFMQFPEVHGAQFLTCKVRAFRSSINGVESNWCHDIRRDNAHCAQWKDERACSRCKYAFYKFTRAECHHPSFEKKFEDGEYAGQSYWPDQHQYTYEENSLRRVYGNQTCGKDAPLYEKRK